MKHLISIVVFSLIGLCAFSQAQPELFPDLIRYRNSGWVIEPGATYQWNNTNQNFNTSFNDTTLAISATAKAKFGGYLTFGIHHWIPRGIIINDIDYGLTVKYFAGAETQDIKQTIENTTTELTEPPNWKELQGGLTLNFNRIFRVGYLSFLKIGVGADANYRIFNKTENILAQALVPEQEKLIMQSHISIGYGFPIGERWYMTPKLEFPFFDLNELSTGKAARTHYLVGQRPVLFTLQFKNRWMRKQDGCGPGEKPVDLNDLKRRKKKNGKIKNGQLR